MFNNVICNDCLNFIPNLPDESIAACVCSPPYAQQRSGLYEGIPEKEYPAWCVNWMKHLRPKLKKDGSVFIVIRPHIKNGVVSDYVLKTILALREDGWCECEELIWYKPDAPPLGSVHRPRRVWEKILWFSQTGKPYCNLKACGSESKRVGGFAGSQRFGLGSFLSSQQNLDLEEGVSRCSDLIRVTIGSIEKGVMHPAMYPIGVPDFLIKTFTQIGDVVIDPFCGSGQTCLSAFQAGRQFIGIDCKQEYVDIALTRLRQSGWSP